MSGPEAGGASGLGPLGDVQLVAAMLRSDRDDIASYVRVLSQALASALPPGLLDVQYDRSFADRVAGRPGRPVRVLVHGADADFEISDTGHGRIGGQLRRLVGGVVISRRDIGLEEWVHLLAVELTARAAQDAAARDALARLLGT